MEKRKKPVDKNRRLVIVLAVLVGVAITAYPIENEIFRAIAVSHINMHLDNAIANMRAYLSNQHINITAINTEQANTRAQERTLEHQVQLQSLNQSIYDAVDKAVDQAVERILKNVSGAHNR